MRQTRRPFFRSRLVRIVALMLSTLLVILYSAVVEPNWRQVSYLDLTLPTLGSEFDQYKIVHISDIHADEWMNTQRLQKLVQQVNQLQPDAIAITGDLVTTQAARFSPILLELTKLESPDGVFAVLGNHDHGSNPKIIRRALEEANVKVLQNETKILRRQNQQVSISGVDDVWYAKDDLKQVLSQLPEQSSNILLVHEPDFADQSAPSHAFDLQLSGHSHGGQVKLPLLGAPQLPPYGRKYPYGLYKVDQMWEYTSRGVGMVRPRVRLNARPQITVLTLHSPKTVAGSLDDIVEGRT